MSALWAFTGPPDPDLVRRMGGALAHRAPRAQTSADATANATLAVARSGDNPRLGGLAKETDGCLTVAFAGRLCADSRIHDVLRAFAADGMEALADLRGEWILAVRDDRRLVIARDAAGVRTAFWGRHRGRVFVAVEPKGVLAAPGFPRRIHAPSLAQYLAFSFVPGEGTALSDLFELPAGHRLDIDLDSGRVKVVRWFHHEEIEACDGAPEDWVGATRAAVDSAIAERIPAQEPVSVFLSGGLDSSLVAATAAKVRSERGEAPPITWSLHFGDCYPNELPYAAAVATLAGTDHRVVEVSGRSVRDSLRRLVWHLDEPIGDPVTAGTFALAEAASQESDWVLNGEGGDPLFGGPKNLPMLLAHWYPLECDRRYREAQYLATWRRAAEDITQLVSSDFLQEIDFERDLDCVVRPFFTADRPRHFLNKLMIANMRMKGAHLILPKVDRMLGAFGTTPLSPLFDLDVLLLSLKMPPRAKLWFGVEKWALKQAYGDLLPAEVIARPKSGMRVPVRWWFRRDLSRLAADVLSPRSVRRAGIFRPERVRELRRGRDGRDGLRLWMLVTFELWRRMVVEGEAP